MTPILPAGGPKHLQKPQGPDRISPRANGTVTGGRQTVEPPQAGSQDLAEKTLSVTGDRSCLQARPKIREEQLCSEVPSPVFHQTKGGELDLSASTGMFPQARQNH